VWSNRCAQKSKACAVGSPSLRAEMDQQKEASIEIVGTASGQYGNKIYDYVDAQAPRISVLDRN
jgi:hypothetical protein